MDKKKVRRLSLLGMILCVVLWGLTPLVSKHLMNKGYDSPALLIAVRCLISVVVLGLVLLFTGKFKKITKAYWVCLPAGLIMGGAYLFQFIGLGDTSLSKNTFLESFSVITVPIAMFAFTLKKPSLLSVVASIGCLAGAFVLCGNGLDFSAMFTSPSRGDIFSAIGGALFGVNIAFTKVFAKDKDPYVYVFFQLLITTALCFAYALPFEPNLTFSWETENILLTLFLALFCTVACWLLRTASIKNVSAVTCAVLNPMSAVIATSLSMSLLMEPFSWNVVVGGLIIVASIVLSGVVDAKKETKEEAKAIASSERDPLS